jgi:hypothetical protein
MAQQFGRKSALCRGMDHPESITTGFTIFVAER